MRHAIRFSLLLSAGVLVATPRSIAAQQVKYGYMNPAGDMVIPQQFDSAGAFKNGVAIVKVGQLYGLIDRNGDFVVEPRFTEMPLVPYDAAIMGRECRDCPWEQLDSAGTLIRKLENPEGKYVFLGGDSRVWMNRETMDWFVDDPARVIFNARAYAFDWDVPRVSIAHYGFQEGLIKVKDPKTRKWGFLNERGEVAIPLTLDSEPESFASGRAIIAQSTRNSARSGAIDRTGKVVIKAEWGSIEPFADGIAAASSDRGWVVIDTTGKVLTKPMYGRGDVRFGMAVIGPSTYMTSDWAVVDRSGKPVVVPRHPHRILDDSTILTIGVDRPGQRPDDTYMQLRDLKGEIIKDSIHRCCVSEIQPFSEGLAVVYGRTLAARIAESRAIMQRAMADDSARAAKLRNDSIAKANRGKPRVAAVEKIPDGMSRYVYYVVRQSMRATSRTVKSGGYSYTVRSHTWYVDYAYIIAPTGTSPGSLSNLVNAPHRSLTMKAGEGVFLDAGGGYAVQRAMSESGVRKKEEDYLSSNFMGKIVK